MNLDDHNLRMLELLQQDARMSVAEISRRIGLAESTVRERLESLVSRGVVRGFRADVDASLLGCATHVLVRAQCDLSRLDELTGALQGVGAVTRAVRTTGLHGLEIELRAHDMAEIERVLVEDLAPLGVGPFETHVVSRELVPLRPPGVSTGSAIRSGARELVSP